MSFMPKKYRFDIKNSISNNKNKNLEIELRFRGDLNDENIDSLTDFLIENDYDENKNFTIDYIGSLNGSSETIRISKEDNKYYETSKSNILNSKFQKNNYSMKLSVNREIRKEIKEKPNIINELIRKKDRTTFTKDNLQVDITRVDENDLKRIELEIEVIDADEFIYEDFDSLASIIFENISTSHDSIVQYFSKALSGVESDNFKTIYPHISKPRDLQIQDLTNDGILRPFAISLKADGIQKFLLLHPGGVFFIDSSSVKKIDSRKFEKSSLYVGEYIEANDLYLPFDTIVFENKNVRNENYLTRYNFCSKINKMKLKKIYISEKPIYTYDSNVESFNKTITKVYQTADKSKFNIDGLIFTPIDSSYVTDGQNKRLDKRVLSNYNDVCKYKKPEDLTIDFLVKDNTIWSYDPTVRTKLKRPWFMNENNTSKETFLVDKWKNKVVEFTPIFTDDNIVYRPVRVRADKEFPNKLEVAEKLFRLRKNPIEKETLEGKTTQLMRKYHNVIKRNLIASQSGYVIDIGSGKGGDLDKYANNENIKKVFSIEPQAEHINEYNQRLSKLKKGKDKFYNVQGGGEDTEKIIKGSSKWFTDIQKYDKININFMISLSFFWRDLKTLKKIAHTINSIREHYKRQKVLINFLTIEGEQVEKLFEKRGKDKVVLNTITLIKKGDNQIYVDIKDGKTVHEQEEYLVKLNQLWELTNFFPRIIFPASGGGKNDYILSLGEQIYSSLFMFGTAYHDPLAFNSKTALLVDEKNGVKTDQGVMAHGDDATEPFFKNLTRLAVLKKHGSLYHSLLKLLSEKYRDSDVFTRVKMAKDLSLKLDPDLQTIAGKINHGIKVHEGPYKTTKYNNDAKKWIFLHRTSDNEFEPLVFDDGENHHFVFNNDSDLV
jgi:hypothetical protein